MGLCCRAEKGRQMNKDLLIVGNGTPKRPFADLVDRYDNVLRMNLFRTKGYEDIVGKKTTIIATNRQVGYNHVEKHEGADLWLLRTKAHTEEIEKTYEGQDHLLVIDDSFRRKAFDVVDQKEKFKSIITYAEMGKTTLGACVVLKALIEGYRPVLVNFDFGETGHYFNPSQNKGWVGHNWELEAAMMKYLASKGKIVLLDSKEDLSEKAAVCVLCWGDEECLRVTLEEFDNEPDDNIHFFLYFQEFNEDSEAIVSDFNQYIRAFHLSPDNIGNSIPRNQMIDDARRRGYGYIGFLDADIIPNRNAFPYFLEFLKNIEEYDAVTSYCQKKVSDIHDPDRVYDQPEFSKWEVDPMFFSIEGKFPCFPSQNSLWRTEKLDSIFFPEYHPFDKPGWGAEDNIAGYNYMYETPGKIATVLRPEYRHLLHSSWHKLDFETNVFQRCLYFEFYRFFFTQEERKKINSTQVFPKIVVDYIPNPLMRKFLEYCDFIEFRGTDLYPKVNMPEINFSESFNGISSEDWKQIFTIIESLISNRDRLTLEYGDEA